MRLGLVVNGARDEARGFAARLVEEGAPRGLDVLARADTAPLDLPRWDDEPVDVVIGVGGDGTMLEAVRHAVDHDLPVLGFNLGTVGFLTEAEPEMLEDVLDLLASGRFEVSERMTLRATLPGGITLTGVNDVVIEKIESQRLVVLALEVDETRFLHYRADGVVIATSTGSTAYNFSAGGPLVDPSLDLLMVTPVAPHSLFNRTLVLSPDAGIRCRVAARRPVRVSVDGIEIGTLHEGGAVEVERGPTRARFVRVDGGQFASRITRKFGVD